MKIKHYNPTGYFSINPPKGYTIAKYNNICGKIVGKIIKKKNIK